MTTTSASPADVLGAGGADSTTVEVVVTRATTPSVHHVPAPGHPTPHLPFTGAPIVLLLVVAAVLFALGCYLRRLAACSRKDAPCAP